LFLLVVKNLESKTLIIKWKNVDIYNFALSGIKESGIRDYDVIDCDGKKEEILNGLKNVENYDLICVLGETPLKVVISEKIKKPVFYGMVYNPVLFVGKDENVTGVSLNINYLKQLTIIKSVLPNCKSVGILYSKEELVKQFEKDAENFGISVKKIKSENENDVNEKINLLKDVSLIVLITDPIISSSGVINNVILHSQKTKIPLFVTSDKLVKSGALFGLSPDYFENGIILGKMIKKYLEENKLENPKDMPDGYLYVNLKVSSDYNIKIEEKILKTAKEIYK
ncbi:MAG: ABC transporter substrate binding protein, partial [candidate division WOR-3 bacterium]